MPQALIAEVDAWGATNDAMRSEAIRRLVEIGLTMKARSKQGSSARAEAATAMASDQLDQLVDQSASAEQQATRKGRLLKGPEEFQSVRVDRSISKK
jgi:metal-responsive CopG/Arc/MetJ family transcriptional regulator